MIQPQDVFDEVPHPDDTGPDHDAQAAVIRLEVERALEELSTRERAAFTLRFHNDLAVKDIADAMGLAEGTVKSLLFRAVHKLRGCLGHLVTDLT